MRVSVYTLVLMLLLPWCLWAKRAEQKECRTVRIADIGWTDVSATTALAAEILRALSYDPKIVVVATPVAFASLKNNELDLFLGNWMPTQEADIRPFLHEGSVVQLKQNLEGARYTLAVPQYVYDAGVTSFSDIAKFADRFNYRIYGIEAGNDGNRLILQMIEQNAFNLGRFDLIESSEQAMLAAVREAVKKQEFIVFLGWAPHPMNLSIAMRYLDDGDAYFGPNLGESQVFTVARKTFAKDCPNLAKLFMNMSFTVDMENELMSEILHNQLTPTRAAQKWLKANKAHAQTWLTGISTAKGRAGHRALDTYVALLENDKVYEHKYKAPVGLWAERLVIVFASSFASNFRVFSDVVETVVDTLVKSLLLLHWGILIGVFALLGFVFHRSVKLMLMTCCGLLLIVNFSLWEETIKTLVLVLLATCTSILIGVPLGILSARKPWFYRALRPMLDLMQTIPTFVYLIPSLMLFGLGLVPGLISTIVFAVAAPIRLTHLGISSVPRELIEASRAFGATDAQTLMNVELPYARPSLIEGVSQCIMLSLSMVVIAALVGADGLGTPVIRALNTVDIGQGFESGIAIVIIAVLLDRTLRAKRKRIGPTPHRL